MYFLFLFTLLLVSPVQDEVPLNLSVKWTTETKLDPANTVYFSKSQKLKWSDFKAIPATNARSVAATSAGFGYVAGMRRTNTIQEINISVYCYFDRKTSWVLANSKTDNILKHEQLHFDISYVAALWFIEQLNKTSFTNKNYKTVLPALYQQGLKYLNDLQDDYDYESHHGLNAEEQKKWEEKVRNLIDEYEGRQKLPVIAK
jgi:hypothetical protein